MPKSETKSEFSLVSEEQPQGLVDLLTVVLSNPMGSNSPATLETRSQPTPTEKIDGIVIGKVVEVEGLQVDYPGNPAGEPLSALSTRNVGREDIGRDVALAFESGDPCRPILIGFIHQPQDIERETPREFDVKNVHLDGERLELTAKKEIVLRCGEASITLTRAGKIIIRGAYLVSRSTGVNRIKGGSVHIN
jgi:Domain of unknown function (DUF6484)